MESRRRGAGAAFVRLPRSRTTNGWTSPYSLPPTSFHGVPYTQTERASTLSAKRKVRACLIDNLQSLQLQGFNTLAQKSKSILAKQCQGLSERWVIPSLWMHAAGNARKDSQKSRLWPQRVKKGGKKRFDYNRKRESPYVFFTYLLLFTGCQNCKERKTRKNVRIGRWAKIVVLFGIKRRTN